MRHQLNHSPPFSSPLACLPPTPLPPSSGIVRPRICLSLAIASGLYKTAMYMVYQCPTNLLCREKILQVLPKILHVLGKFVRINLTALPHQRWKKKLWYSWTPGPPRPLLKFSIFHKLNLIQYWVVWDYHHKALTNKQTSHNLKKLTANIHPID